MIIFFASHFQMKTMTYFKKMKYERKKNIVYSASYSLDLNAFTLDVIVS